MEEVLGEENEKTSQLLKEVSKQGLKQMLNSQWIGSDIFTNFSWRLFRNIQKYVQKTHNLYQSAWTPTGMNCAAAEVWDTSIS